VVVWAGARGVVPLAAALSIPITAADGAPLPERELVEVLATVVIVISLVVQGFTLEPLVRRTGIALAPAIGAREDTTARLRLAQASLDYLEHLEDVEAVPPVVFERARRNLLARRDRVRTTLDGDQPGDPLAPAYRRLRRDLLAVERTELHRLYDADNIGDATGHVRPGSAASQAAGRPHSGVVSEVSGASRMRVVKLASSSTKRPRLGGSLSGDGSAT